MVHSRNDSDNVSVLSLDKMLSEAILTATLAHNGQHDRGGHPYILHPLAVMHMLNTDDVELQCIAVMHDVIEDSTVTYASLRAKGFSERVISGVRCLTRTPGQTEEEYEDMVMSNIDSIRVKKCDLRHNSDLTRLKGIRDKDINRAVRYLKFYYMLESKVPS